MTLYLALMLLPAPALAMCPGPYTHHQWNADLDAVQHALDHAEPAKASSGVRQIYEFVPCLDTVARRGELGRFARLRSITSFFGQEEEATVRWATLQRLAAPGLRWQAQAPPPAWQETIEAMDPPTRGGDSSEYLAAPDGGWVFLDGEFARTARIQAEVPHLAQITDKKGVVVKGWWQDGAHFQDDLIVAEPMPDPTWFREWRWSAVTNIAADPWAFGSEGQAPVAVHGPAVLPKLPPAGLVVPAELNPAITKFPERRAMNVEQFEKRPQATAVLTAMLVREPDPTVQKRAWQAIHSRWEHGRGDDGMAETAARWVISDGPSLLHEDAVDAIGRYSDDPHYLAHLLDDPRAAIHRGAISAIEPFAARHPECRDLLWHKLGELRLVEKNTKVINELDHLLGLL